MESIDGLIVQIIGGLIGIAITAVLGVGSKYLLQLDKLAEKKLGTEQRDLLRRTLIDYIYAAAAMFDQNEQKLDYVYKLARQLADRLGLELTDEQIRAMIEGVYRQIKDQVNREWETEEGIEEFLSHTKGWSEVRDMARIFLLAVETATPDMAEETKREKAAQDMRAYAVGAGMPEKVPYETIVAGVYLAEELDLSKVAAAG